MLFLLFQLGDDWYGLPAVDVVEVLPSVRLKQIPKAPPAVAGLCLLEGESVPVIDLTMLSLGRAARSVLSTRIILVHSPDRHGVPRLLGLLAERATETLRREPSDFIDAGVHSDGAPYLGPVVHDVRGVIQWIAAEKLLPVALRDLLFVEDARA